MNLNEINGILKCDYCNKLYEQPITLPCGETICKNDLKILSNSTNSSAIPKLLNCPFCKCKHYFPNEASLTENKRLTSLLNIYLNKTNRNNLPHTPLPRRTNLDKFRTKYIEFNLLINEPISYLSECLEKIRSQIESKRKENLVHLNKIFDGYLTELNEFEIECQENLKSFNKQNENLKIFDSKLEEFEACFSNDQVFNSNDEINRFNKLKLDLDNTIHELDLNLNKIKNNILCNKECKFQSKEFLFEAKSFGQIVFSHLINYNIDDLVSVSTQSQNEKSLNDIKRHNHRSVCTNEFIWIWGGNEYAHPTEAKQINKNYLNEIWKYKISNGNWEILKTTGQTPNPIYFAMTLNENNLIVFGGIKEQIQGGNLSNSIYMCNLDRLEWTKYETSGEQPLASYGNSILLISNHLYILFGHDSAKSNSNVYRVNMTNFKSEKLFDSNEALKDPASKSYFPDDFLNGRLFQEVLVFNNKIYVFGGVSRDKSFFSLSYLPFFDLKDSKWKFVNTLPDPTLNEFPQQGASHSCLRIGLYVYMLSGYYLDLKTNELKLSENCIWKLNLRTLQWTKLITDIPIFGFFAAYCSNSIGDLFIHGGMGRKTDTNHFFRIKFN